MSQWTHVAGLIRVDAIPFLGDNPEVALPDVLGKTASYEDSREVWDVCTVPAGSEGSVQYRIEHTGDANSLSWGVVYIWGDLRDYEDFPAIFAWLQQAVEDLRAKHHMLIRSCSVKVDVEYHKSFIIYDNGDGKLCGQVLYEHED